MNTKITASISVDLEDWYHGIEKPIESWNTFEKRLEIGTNIILEIFQQYSISATFFVLGIVAEEHPKIVTKIASLGHEIGSHSYYHKKLYELTPRNFRMEESKSKDVIEQLIGKQVNGFRAPYFSITKQSLWSLDILGDLGYKFDSSISPVQTWRYGIPGFQEGIYRHSNGLIELSPSSMTILGKKLGVGGAYFRILPAFMTLGALREKVRGLYLHPWEFDFNQPRIKMPVVPKLTHYINLKSSRTKLEKICKNVDFITISKMIDIQLNEGILSDLDSFIGHKRE